MKNKPSTGHSLSPHRYLGLQPRVNRPPLILINTEVGTFAYKPHEHTISDEDFQRLINDCRQDLICQKFFTHLYNHWRQFGKDNLDYICLFYHIKRPELENWFDIMLMAGLLKKDEECITLREIL